MGFSRDKFLGFSLDRRVGFLFGSGGSGLFGSGGACVWWGGKGGGVDNDEGEEGLTTTKVLMTSTVWNA